MNDDLMILLQYVAPASVVAIGLVLAVAVRRRLGRAAALAICAFAALFIAYVGSMMWFRHVQNVFADARPGAADVFVTAYRVQWALVTVSVVGFTLLLAAMIAGSGRAHSAAESPSDSAKAL